ncbi:hypothetical protein BMS3Bbin04_01198 [bacterium BMS3Bbin04]|nr:hypothetical protein BMS3Bbin04_01198 [bacterium BMS3Bbin04]
MACNDAGISFDTLSNYAVFTVSIPDLIRNLDIGTTTRHVGCNRDRAGTSSLRHNFSFLLVLLGVQNCYIFPQFATGNCPRPQHTGDKFAGFNRRCTHQNRQSEFMQPHDLVNNCFILFTLGAEDFVIEVFTLNRTIWGDDGNVHLVNLEKFFLFSLSCTGHPCQFAIEPEIVLQSDGGDGLGLSLNTHAFLSFNRLVQSIRIPATMHDTTGKGINYLHLAIFDDVLVILTVQRVRPKQL